MLPPHRPTSPPPQVYDLTAFPTPTPTPTPNPNQVYDLTAFAEEHPAGPESITALAGQDGTAAFEDVHNQQMLSEFDSDLVGVLGN